MAAGDYSILFAPDEMSAQERASALADALRGRERDALALQALTGGPRAAPQIGQALFQGAQAERQALGSAAGERLRMAMQERANNARTRQQEAQDAATREYRNAQLGLDRQRLGLQREQVMAGQGRRDEGAERRATLDVAKTTGDLRRELQGQQVYKDAQTVSSAWEKIKNTGESGAGDMSLIFGYMKILDPNSTVREGEYATAANAGSVPQNLQASYNKAVDGQKLAPEVRKQFRQEAAKVYQAQIGRYRATAGEYKRLAEKAGAAPEDVVLDVFEPQTAAAPENPVQRAQGKDGKWYVNRGAGWEAE